MGDTERVQVEQGGGQLMGEFLRALFGDSEITSFEVVEQISTGEVLHHDVNVVLVLEEIQKSDNVRVLAHLQDFDFTSLELNILNRHFLLGHDLDSNLFASLLVDTGLDQTEFTLS